MTSNLDRPPKQVAVVTGAARGIGKSVAQRLAQDGFAVVIADIRAEAAEATAAEMRAGGAQAIAAQADVSSAAACAALMTHCVAQLGRLDVLVNNAGISQPCASLEVTPADWQRMIDIQLSGAFYCAQAAGRYMAEHGGGSIVSITSINAEAAFPRRASYSVAKAGVAMLTKVLAIEWAELGIRVNAVGPSHTETEMTLANIEKGNIDSAAIKRRIPLGRLAKPSDVADAVAFLCSDKASYITGQSLYVDGGYLAYGYL